MHHQNNPGIPGPLIYIMYSQGCTLPVRNLDILGFERISGEILESFLGRS
jgi:hypothetical protein